MRRLYVLIILALSGIFFQCEAPCTRSVPQSQIMAVDQTRLQQDIDAIDAYLASNSITAIKDPSGIRYKVDVQGTGSMPCIENSVTVSYKGRLMSNNSQFDANSNVSFALSGLILGWRIVLPKLQKGAKAVLYIPSGFGYGPAGFGSSIPPNSNLIFEIELHK